jgi:hypothetical protein
LVQDMPAIAACEDEIRSRAAALMTPLPLYAPGASPR